MTEKAIIEILELFFESLSDEAQLKIATSIRNRVNDKRVSQDSRAVLYEVSQKVLGNRKKDVDFNRYD